MKLVLALFVGVVWSSVSVCGQPTVSDNFQAGVVINVVRWGPASTNQLMGFFGQDALNQRTLLVGNYSTALLYDTKLYRKKIEAVFIINSTFCQLKSLKEEFSPLFSFLRYSSYQGNTVVSGMVVQQWSLNVTASSGVSSLNVYLLNASYPVRLTVADQTRLQTTIFDFYSFQPVAPPDPYFSIPTTCGGKNTMTVSNMVDGMEKEGTAEQAEFANYAHTLLQRVATAQ